DKISAIILTDLDAILTGAKVSTGTVHSVDIPKTEISFDCNSYSVGRGRISIGDKIIFSPDVIKGNKLITWALDWNAPFWINNFLYLTSPEVRYIIVNNPVSNLDDKIKDDWLPDEIIKESVNSMVYIEDKNNYRVRFILIDQDPSVDIDLTGLAGMRDEQVTAIKIVPDGISETIGEISFYNKTGSSWRFNEKTPYLSKESMIGAIFASDIDTYNCAMEKAFAKFRIMSSIYENRSRSMYNYYSSGSCSSAHSLAQADLSSISNSQFIKLDIDTIYNNMVDLEQLNGRAQLYSCVLIY
ncbi:MAG: hypothetical protein ABIJ08_00500, partial [Nanoarchaeota archaeon]